MVAAPVAFMPELSAVGLVGVSVALQPELATARMAAASVGTVTVREPVALGSDSGALPSELLPIARSNIGYATHIRQAKTLLRNSLLDSQHPANADSTLALG